MRGMRMHDRYGINLLAVARSGEAPRARLGNIQFKVGDVLLLQGERNTMQQALAALGCLPLADRGLKVARRRQILLPIGIFGAAIAATASGMVPVQIAICDDWLRSGGAFCSCPFVWLWLGFCNLNFATLDAHLINGDRVLARAFERFAGLDVKDGGMPRAGHGISLQGTFRKRPSHMGALVAKGVKSALDVGDDYCFAAQIDQFHGTRGDFRRLGHSLKVRH